MFSYKKIYENEEKINNYTTSLESPIKITLTNKDVFYTNMKPTELDKIFEKRLLKVVNQKINTCYINTTNICSIQICDKKTSIN